MSRAARILIVDDDPHIREVVDYALKKEGFETAQAGDGEAALTTFEEVQPSLVILDILMPEMDGTEVCRRLRMHSRTPIIFLSSKDDEIDKILGLELGGDDYVTKPFSPRELVARVRAVLRRNAPGQNAGTEARTGVSPEKPRVLRHGKIVLDLDRVHASWDGREVVLTATEFGLLETLVTYPGKVYSRAELMERAYPEATLVADRTIDSHIRRIRRKFQDAAGDPIETVHGLGYRVGPCT